MSYGSDADQLANSSSPDCVCQKTGCRHEELQLKRAQIFALLHLGDQIAETTSFLDEIAARLDRIADRLEPSEPPGWIPSAGSSNHR